MSEETALMGSPTNRAIPFTEAARGMSRLATEVERGRSVVIERRKSRFLLCSAELAREAFACRYPFSPEVFFSDDDVSIWLPELNLHGAGTTLDDAQDDLLEAVSEYLDEWQAGLYRAPNHAGKAGWVQRLLLAETPQDLRSALFAE